MGRYLYWLAALFIAGLALTIAVNATVDPDGVLGSRAIEGWTAPKTESHYHSRLARAYDLCRVDAAALVLGASDVALGLDPAHPGWSARPVYNLGLAAANIHELRRYFEYALAEHPVKQVVLSLDITSFDEELADKPDFDERRIAADGRCGREPEPWALLVSIDTLYSSGATLLKNASNWPTWTQREDGMWQWRRAGDAIRAFGGSRAIFDAVVQNTVNGDLLPPSRYALTIAADDAPHSRFDDFRAIVDISLREGIDLRLMFGPLHATILETRHAVGLDGAHARWVRRIVRILAEETAKHPERSPIPLWDFGGYNTVTTEPVPAANDPSLMRWYLDPVHYDAELGHMILDRIFGTSSPERPLPPDFGVRMTSENVDDRIARAVTAGNAYRRSHAKDVEGIEATVRRALARRASRGIPPPA